MGETIKVNETLSVETTAVEGPKVRIVRRDGGLVAVELSEVVGLVEALTGAALRLSAEVSGQEFQDDLF